MGRKKLTVKRIENTAARQVTYCKRKDGIVKKASELAVLCDTDVALVMFSPSGRLTSFASNGRVEDILLRYINRPDELRGGPIWNEEYIVQRLKQQKCEGELMEKMAKIEALEEILNKINQHQCEAQEKLRYYNPNLEKINSILEAGVYQQSITSAIQRLELSKAKLLGSKVEPKRCQTTEVADAASIITESVDSNQQRNPSKDEHHHEKACLSSASGPHLSLSFLQGQNQWKISGGNGF